MGDGRAPTACRLFETESLARMHSDPGTSGTLVAEIDGFGITIHLRRTAERITIVDHGGDLLGRRSGLLAVPECELAMTSFTNSDGARRKSSCSTTTRRGRVRWHQQSAR